VAFPCEVEAYASSATKLPALKADLRMGRMLWVKVKGKSFEIWGYQHHQFVSSTSFFHTVEGGAVFTKSAETDQKTGALRNSSLGPR